MNRPLPQRERGGLADPSRVSHPVYHPVFWAPGSGGGWARARRGGGGEVGQGQIEGGGRYVGLQKRLRWGSKPAWYLFSRSRHILVFLVNEPQTIFSAKLPSCVFRDQREHCEDNEALWGSTEQLIGPLKKPRINHQKPMNNWFRDEYFQL